MSYQSPRNSISQYQYNPATPPLPPPKPSGQSSGTATPTAGPPPPPLPYGQQGSVGQPYQETNQASQPQQYAPTIEPPPPGWLPGILENKTLPDLQSIVSSTELQQALLHDPATAHPSIAASEAPLKDLLASNLALAAHLKTLEAQIKTQREATQSRLLALRALERQFRQKQGEQEAALRDFSAPALYQKLVGAISEQEQLCRGIEESFLEGGVDGEVASEREVSEWVRRLKEARKVAYLRRERKERWDEGRVGGWR